MSTAVDTHGRVQHVLMLASNPAVRDQTVWPVGLWWAALTHAYWKFLRPATR